MNKKILKKKIKKILSKQLGINLKKIRSYFFLKKDLEADSLDLIELVMELEEKFEIDITDEEIEKIKTVQEIIDFTHSKICIKNKKL